MEIDNEKLKLPWRVDYGWQIFSGKQMVADCCNHFNSREEAESIAAFITLAVNTHRELRDALQYAEKILSATECTGRKQLGNGAALDAVRLALQKSSVKEGR